MKSSDIEPDWIELKGSNWIADMNKSGYSERRGIGVESDHNMIKISSCKFWDMCD